MSYETGRQAFRDGKTLAETSDKVATEETLGWLDELADTVRRLEVIMSERGDHERQAWLELCDGLAKIRDEMRGPRVSPTPGASHDQGDSSAALATGDRS